MDGKRIYKVSYHQGSLFALVETDSPDEAVEIARAHRKAKRVWKGTPPASLDTDAYTVSTPSERDIRWCHECGVGVQTGMPSSSRRNGAPGRGSGLRAIRLPQDVKRAEGVFRQVA